MGYVECYLGGGNLDPLRPFHYRFGSGDCNPFKLSLNNYFEKVVDLGYRRYSNHYWRYSGISPFQPRGTMVP